MASIQGYLQDRLEEHCRDFVETEMGINPDTDKEEFEEEVRDHMKLMEMGIWRDWSIIDTAYYMEIPKKALYRFGYTKKEINRIFLETWSEEQFPDGYPY